MNSVRLLQLIILGMAFSGIFSLRALAATSAVDALGRQLAAMTSFTANFKQSSLNSHQQVLQQSQGKVMMLRPGKFWWETLEPTHQLLITNGKKLWIYDVDLQQVTEDRLADKGNLSPAQLLSGSVTFLKQQFTIKQESTATYLLTPKSRNSEFKWVRLSFAHQQLVRMEFANSLGEDNVFEFDHIKTNVAIAPDTFEFKTPKGVDVLVNQ
jgi:outer membrane lipoprotein carrier protein